MYTNFEWPLPHYYQASGVPRFEGHEHASVRMLDGRTLEGTLTRFLPSHGVVEFTPEKERANLSLSLAEIEQLWLSHPVVLRPRDDQDELDRRGPVAKPSETQTVRIEFVNGRTLTADTAGFDMQEAGLFLFVRGGKQDVLRTFIPASSIRKEQIGPLIGKTLVEQKILTDDDVERALERQRLLRSQKIGDILAGQKVISLEQLHQALERERGMPVVKLGEALVRLKLLTDDELRIALDVQRENRKKPLGEILLDLGLLSKEQLARAMAQKLGIPMVDLSRFQIDPAVLKVVPEEIVRRSKVLPLCYDKGRLVVAMVDPLDQEPLERVRFCTQAQIAPVMATSEDIRSALAAYFGSAPEEQDVGRIAEQLQAEVAPEAERADAVIADTDNTLVRLVNKMIVDAHANGASDIHIEANAGKTSVVIRFRKDGVLSEYLRLPYNFRNAAVSRLKIMAGMDISEHRRAQDGRINFARFGPANVELRVVTVPTQDGLEDLVLRLLAAGEPLPITKLGLRDPVLAAVRELIERPYGLFLVVGPTGSGKTTTLHSLVAVLNVPDLKIWTAENPVEITQPGLRQVQVNTKIGWDFATIMRTFLRADPDVILVGEMRDKETAGIAVEASLTGHMVFSTLHTNSAAETVVRLLDMGIDPFSFTDSLLGVLAQRLTRKLCADCRSAKTASQREIESLAEEYCFDSVLQPAAVLAEWRERFEGRLLIYQAIGCDRCLHTGYRGRMGLHELFAATPAIREMMLRRAPASELRAAAVRNGMRTLKQDGIEKSLAGLTDLREVRAAAS